MEYTVDAHRRIRVGVVGAGKMGRNHVRVYNELKNVFDLIGVFDPDESKLSVAEEFGVQYFHSVEDLLERVDAVSIACPTSLHKELAITAAEFGVHALVEKPIAENWDDAADICFEFIARDMTLKVGYVERYNPAVSALKAMLEGKEIVAVEAKRFGPFDGRITDVDVASDLMIHDLDIIQNVLGFNADPICVKAVGTTVHGSEHLDYVHASLRINNVAVQLTASRANAEKQRKIIVHTRDGFVEADLLNKTIACKSTDGTDMEAEVDGCEPLKAELVAFGKAIINNDPARNTRIEISRSMLMLDAIRKEAYANREECDAL